MNVFEAVKNGVTTREAAEFYGIHVNRSGMACCPFHNDRHPSMKIDQRFHCFGCQADGDVIDFVSHLFHLNLKEAALKLADDFNIACKDPPPRNAYPQKHIGQRPADKQNKNLSNALLRCFRALSEYRIHLLDQKEQYAPRSPDDEWDERFCDAMNKLPVIEHHLDILLYGEDEDKTSLLSEKGKEILELEQRIKYIRSCTEKESTRRSRTDAVDDRRRAPERTGV